MEHCYKYDYLGEYETTRNAAATGGASPTGSPVITRRQNGVGSCPMDWGSKEFRVSMADDTQERRNEGTSTERHSRATCSVIGTAEGCIGPSALRGSAGRRIRNRPLDVETHHPSHLETLSYSLSSQSRVADSWAIGMELSKTRTPSKTEGRKSHRALEARAMASHKKKPQDLAPIWYSSMKVAFCSSPMCDAPGHPKERHPIFITGSNKTESPPLARSAFLLTIGISDSIYSSVRVTSRTRMSNSFSNTFCVTFAVRSSCCGIAELSTASVPSRCFSICTRDCTASFFRPMHLSSIQPNTCGIDQTLRSRTEFPTIARNSTADCIPLQPNSDLHKKPFGHAFMLLNYPGLDN